MIVRRDNGVHSGWMVLMIVFIGDTGVGMNEVFSRGFLKVFGVGWWEDSVSYVLSLWVRFRGLRSGFVEVVVGEGCDGVLGIGIVAGGSARYCCGGGYG